jgi:hypothetical protein
MTSGQRFSGWRKASRSDERGDCVEVGFAPGLVGVRDTKDQDGGTLAFAQEEWQHFSKAVKAGTFDLP